MDAFRESVVAFEKRQKKLAEQGDKGKKAKDPRGRKSAKPRKCECPAPQKAHGPVSVTPRRAVPGVRVGKLVVL